MENHRGVNGVQPPGSSNVRVLPTVVTEAPPPVAELARACVQYVTRAVGVELDYTLETLPVLDHYLEQARTSGQARPEARDLVAQAAGAYLGEVIRRRHPSFWLLVNEAPDAWVLGMRQARVSLSPVQLILAALDPMRGGLPDAGILLDDGDREAVAERMALLPEVPEEEFFAPSTRVEVVDIIMDTARERRHASGLPPLSLTASDYGEAEGPAE